MKIVDLNLPLYAVNADAPNHSRARDWWKEALSKEELVALPWVVVLGFLRLTTRAAVFPRPLTIDEAAGTIDGWLGLPNVVLLHPGRHHWEILSRLLRAAGTAGNLTTDAHLAALAIEYDAVLYSTDRDFARFVPKLRLVNPLLQQA